jgi:hypothetical protein
MREPREVQWARAVRLLGAAERVALALGHRLSVAMPEEYERTVEGARVALGEEAFTVAWKAGRAMSLDDAVAFALDETREG